MSTHHIYGGSNAQVWAECNGSPYLSKLAQSEPNEPMKRGTRIHDKAADLIRGIPSADLAPDEMHVADEYTVAVTAKFRDADVESYYKVSLEVGGTVDGIHITETDVHVWDLKTGHTPVSPVNNAQVLFYLWLSFQGYVPDQLVHLGIWHEAFGEFQWWTPTKDEIQVWFAKFELATTSSKKLVAGPHCIKCRAVGICNKVAQPPVSKSDEDIAKNYEMIPLWGSIIKGIESVAETLCTNGNLPGYRMSSGKKKALKWLVEPPAKIANVDVYVKEALSPTQVAKLLGKDGENFIVSSALASRPPSEQIIVKA